MVDRPCGRADCPVLNPDEIDRRRLRSVTWDAGTERFRVANRRHSGAIFTPAGIGHGRFSPLPGRDHTYVAEQRSAALLESALHEAHGPNPRIYRAQLTQLDLIPLQFTTQVRLLDLRDGTLESLGIGPDTLTQAGPQHYGCTQQVANALVGTKATDGFLWTSRQGRMHHERNRDGLAAEVLHHQRLDVAIVYRPGFSGAIDTLEHVAVASDGEPSRFVRELANLLRIAIL